MIGDMAARHNRKQVADMTHGPAHLRRPHAEGNMLQRASWQAWQALCVGASRAVEAAAVGVSRF
jgi:hypothetical protein